jgi:hypothetical protein
MQESHQQAVLLPQVTHWHDHCTAEQLMWMKLVPVTMMRGKFYQNFMYTLLNRDLNMIFLATSQF